MSYTVHPDFFTQVVEQSTCQKRVTLCILYDKDDRVIAVESNRCSPPGGVCQRLGVVQNKDNYATESCNWVHAEMMALARVESTGVKPVRAVVYGHDFFCDACEIELRAAGVTVLEVKPIAPGCGLRT